MKWIAILHSMSDIIVRKGMGEQMKSGDCPHVSHYWTNRRRTNHEPPTNRRGSHALAYLYPPATQFVCYLLHIKEASEYVRDVT
jgi:hypothetical protein